MMVSHIAPIFLLATIYALISQRFIDANGIALELQIGEDGTTTEEEDMGKALALSKTHFWHYMMQAWDCYSARRKTSSEIGLNYSLGELDNICIQWKTKARAVNAYVQSWECQNGRGGTSSSGLAEEFREKCSILSPLLKKPMFRVKEGILQLSSAMKMIEAVYRDFFKWGNGKNLKSCYRQIDNTIFSKQIEFEDCQEWNEILNSNGMWKIVAHYEERQEENDRIMIVHKIISALKTLKFYLDVSNGKADDLANLEMAHQSIEQIWENGKQLGFDMESMCEAGEKTGAVADIRTAFTRTIEKLFNNLSSLKDLSSQKNGRKETNNFLSQLEQSLGFLLWLYKHKIKEPMLAEIAKLDPCEEAVLKVIKNMGTTDQLGMIKDNGQSKVCQMDTQFIKEKDNVEGIA